MPNEDVDVVSDLLRAGGDEARMESLTHPECVIIEPVSLPYGGVYGGESAFTDLFADIYADFSTFDTDLQELVSAGDRVLAEFTLTGTARESDETFETSVVELYRVEDGQIRETDVYYKEPTAVVETLT